MQINPTVIKDRCELEINKKLTSMNKNCGTLFEKIGEDFIKQARKFYHRAFRDPIIGHFFFNKNHQELVAKQIEFTYSFLGSKQHLYRGLPLKKAHQGLAINKAHFLRRQVLLEEVLLEMGLSKELTKQWLQKEKNLMGLIVTK